MVVDSQGNIITTTNQIGYGWDVFGVGFKIVQFSPQPIMIPSDEPMNMNYTTNENMGNMITDQNDSNFTEQIDEINSGTNSVNSGGKDKNNNITITINPGATNSDSQNPISPTNVTMSEGTTII
jgi:hypothetical protein